MIDKITEYINGSIETKKSLLDDRKLMANIEDLSNKCLALLELGVRLYLQA